LITLLEDGPPETRERVAVVIGEIDRGPLVLKALEKAFYREDDDWVMYEIAKSVYGIDRIKGRELLRLVIEEEEVPEFLKVEVVSLLEETTE